jgi:putative aldouronate transport system permease protein
MINLYSLAVFPLSLVLALLLNYMPSLRFKKTVQMISYAPHFISVVVLCGMITQFLNARTGLVNLILQIFNVPAANYMAKPELFRDIYVWSDVWQNIGYNSIIYIAALSAISTELHEAAIVDGANIIRRIWSIDIPGILPTFSVLLILRCGHLFDIGFEKILLLQNNLNLSVSEVISTYTYNIGLATPNPQYSYAAAIGLFKSLVNMVLLFSVNRLVRQLSGSSLF